MKILFTLLSLTHNSNTMYLNACKQLTNEILSQTNHDVLISTNNVEFFSELPKDRVFVRNNLRPNSTITYNSEFNYNLKHHAFIDIPTNYDCLIYLDCDVKLNGWNENSEKLLSDIVNNYDLGADRINCVLKDEVSYYKNNMNCLFKHKIVSYEILTKYEENDDIMNSQLPSEHFLIFKNNGEKIKKFQEKWEELNNYLQQKNGYGGSWGDGFEIGISARYAGMTKIHHTSAGYWDGVLGFKFNGNKF